jgi:hypothetical protein
MIAMKIPCSSCGTVNFCDESMGGRTVKCRNCSHAIVLAKPKIHADILDEIENIKVEDVHTPIPPVPVSEVKKSKNAKQSNNLSAILGILFGLIIFGGSWYFIVTSFKDTLHKEFAANGNRNDAAADGEKKSAKGQSSTQLAFQVNTAKDLPPPSPFIEIRLPTQPNRPNRPMMPVENQLSASGNAASKKEDNQDPAASASPKKRCRITREWKDESGKYSLRAALQEIADNKVLLERSDTHETHTIPLIELSKIDRLHAYTEEFAKDLEKFQEPVSGNDNAEDLRKEFVKKYQTKIICVQYPVVATALISKTPAIYNVTVENKPLCLSAPICLSPAKTVHKVIKIAAPRVDPTKSNVKMGFCVMGYLFIPGTEYRKAAADFFLGEFVLGGAISQKIYLKDNKATIEDAESDLDNSLKRIAGSEVVHVISASDADGNVILPQLQPKLSGRPKASKANGR